MKPRSFESHLTRATVLTCGLLVYIVGHAALFEPSIDGFQEDLSSKAQSSKAKTEDRAPILGNVVPTDKSPKDEVSVLMNDLSIHQKWGLVLTDTNKAWRVTKGSRDIVVAIIDTGADLQHPELMKNLWVNKGETGLDAKGRNKANNGVDDDGDGLIDDVHGWNFVNNNNELRDTNSHGTHIAGIVGAAGVNGKGFSGISPNVSLMILKYYDEKEPGSTLKNTVRAINYAVEHGAHIINYSGGGIEPSQLEKLAIERAQKKGILVVAAAGNERSNSDVRGYYPADYGLSNVISVTAIDKTRSVLPSSNYGVKSVDVAAPGNEIYSTIPGGRYGYLTGTSQATAFVTGVAALIMANNRDYTAQDVIKAITRTGDVETGLEGKTRYQRRLNSYRALATIDQGIAATGVVAANTVGMKQHLFTTSEGPAPHVALPSASVGQLTQLGAMLNKKLVPARQRELRTSGVDLDE